MQVLLPSPGGMTDNTGADDPLVAWSDCYDMKPKRRISRETAKQEIQRAWAIWEGDRNGPKMLFYTWLQRHRPYFLTFVQRGNLDKWQTVNSWLVQYEDRAHSAE